ncbi:hypothetical protein BDV93DRAFT_529345 [Ceratobasidium sp. AG-I]|nr:hypothetical protein BDV93DRAFT_529345 [Ceratobasidium sp. AG-I]
MCRKRINNHSCCRPVCACPCSLLSKTCIPPANNANIVFGQFTGGVQSQPNPPFSQFCLFSLNLSRSFLSRSGQIASASATLFATRYPPETNLGRGSSNPNLDPPVCKGESESARTREGAGRLGDWTSPWAAPPPDLGRLILLGAIGGGGV